jgi:tRNA pseudouridine32 synthase / 23S rRNA pseudouridine746 synthase
LNEHRSGVKASVVALPGDVSAWPTLLDFFVARFPHVSRNAWLQRFALGEISSASLSGDAAPVQAHEAPRAHVKLAYFRHVEHETHIPFDEVIIYQDEHIVVADKPHFLPVVPSGEYVQETLLARLQTRLCIETLTPIHRIDRETAGLVVFCVKPEARGAYQTMFRDRRVTKYYEAIAAFRETLAKPRVYRSRLVDAAHFMQMKEVAGEANSETHIEMIERRGDLARYALAPHTGKRHQLRVHMNALGAPIVNDRIYPTLLPQDEFATFDNPLQLLAKSIEFVDPLTHATRCFTSEHALWERACVRKTDQTEADSR